MDKNKKLIIGAVVIVVVLIITMIIIKINIGNGDKNTSDTVTTVAGQVQEKNASGDEEYVTLPEQTEKTEEVSETNYFDNMSIYEETSKKAKKKNKKNKKNKNQETEAYPGENDGWSPIVSPDDLEQ